MNWIHKLLSEKDNATPCPVRWGSALIAAVYHAGAVFMMLFQGFHLDMPSLGLYVQHMCTLLGVASVGVGAKSAMQADAPPADAP